MATQAQAVRAWARTQGYDVGVRGRIAPNVWEAYATAHDDFKRETPAGTARCGDCGRWWTGLRECHCTVCHAHFSTVDGFDAHRPSGTCINPLDARVKGDPLREKTTVWGPIFVRDGEHWKTEGNEGLYD